MNLWRIKGGRLFVGCPGAGIDGGLMLLPVNVAASPKR